MNDKSILFPVLPALVDGEWFGFNALFVKEIVAGQAWMPLPGAREETPGFTFWNHMPIAVVDLKALLGDLPGLEPEVRRERLLVVMAGAETVGIPVDAAREVKQKWDGEIAPLASSGADRGRYPEDLPLIDVVNLLAELARDTAYRALSSQSSTPDSSSHLGSSFAVVRGRSAHWAVAAGKIERMLAGEGQRHIECIDLLDFLGVDVRERPSRAESRVLVLSAPGGEAHVRVPSDIEFRQIAGSEIHSLPSLLVAAGGSRAVLGVCQGDGKGVVFIVDTERLPRSTLST